MVDIEERRDNEKDESFDVDEDLDQRTIEKRIRLAFIRKVYGIITFQILITSIFVYFSITYPVIENFIRNNYWLIFLCSIVALITEIIIVCCKGISRQVPINYFLLLIFTICESFVISAISIDYEKSSVFRIACFTCALVVGVSLYACFTKTDYTLCGFFLCIMSVSLFVISIFLIFFHNPFMDTLITCGETILFIIYLIYDTQLVIGNKKNLIQTDDYINAALQIYIDIIVLFIKLLRLFGKKKK